MKRIKYTFYKTFHITSLATLWTHTYTHIHSIFKSYIESHVDMKRLVVLVKHLWKHTEIPKEFYLASRAADPLYESFFFFLTYLKQNFDMFSLFATFGILICVVKTIELNWIELQKFVSLKTKRKTRYTYKQ